LSAPHEAGDQSVAKSRYLARDRHHRLAILAVDRKSLLLPLADLPTVNPTLQKACQVTQACYCYRTKMAEHDLAPLTRLVADSINDLSSRGIAVAVGRLVANGTLRAGTRLPTVRELARALGVSPARVDEAWKPLARNGVIQTEGRRGSFVRGSRTLPLPTRWWSLGATSNNFKLDLSSGAPDPLLLPRLDAALQHVSERPFPTNYLDHTVVPDLEAVLRERWRPSGEPDSMTIVSGALDAFDRIFGVALSFGDRVLVEEPGYPPIFDLVEAHGAEAVPVSLDAQGIDPISLRDALAVAPTALVLQPRAQNPTGVAMSAQRSRELSKVLRGTGVIVIEDDHSGDIVGTRSTSLAKHVLDQTIRVTSFSKSHGPDLRLAAVGGPKRYLDPLVARRALGPGWSSRLLQSLLARMLGDAQTIAEVRRARSIYAERRARLVRELRRLGIQTTEGDGINLWISVAREREAVHRLAAQGISVAPGTPFFIRSEAPAHIRVTSGVVSEGHAELAVAIAGAARPYLPSRGSTL
jgi:DNA-binding transcriptional MocR family regulator